MAKAQYYDVKLCKHCPFFRVGTLTLDERNIKFGFCHLKFDDGHRDGTLSQEKPYILASVATEMAIADPESIPEWCPLQKSKIVVQLKGDRND